MKGSQPMIYDHMWHCDCVDGIGAEPLCCKSDVEPANNYSPTKQSLLNDGCVFKLTSNDEDDRTVQSEKCDCTRCEF